MNQKHSVNHPEYDSDHPEYDSDESLVEVEDQEPASVPEVRQQPESIATSKPKRNIRKPARYTDMVAYALPITGDDIPYNYREAVQSMESDKWKMAMDEKMRSLYQNQTWKLVPLPKRQEID